MKISRWGKIIFTFLIILQTVFSYGQFKYTYKEHREPNSKLLLFGPGYTMEKLKNGKVVYKIYYPELRVNTQKITFKDRKSGIKDGPYIERYDDGKVIAKGEYVNNQKQGHWKEQNGEGEYVNNEKHGEWEEYNSKGKYENGKKVGEWLSYDSKDRISGKSNFLEDELHGEQVAFDTLGQITETSIYENGKLVSTTIDTTDSASEHMPRFSGCENLKGTNKEKKACADKKMLTYVYQNIKYPKIARKQEIEGMALVRFVINKDGTVADIKVLRGLCDAIKEECLRVVSGMPRWTPGYKDGKPVKVQFNLPIRFNLK